MSFSRTTNHTIYNKDCRDMSNLVDASIDLVVTSPPYPMVEMWDEVFASLSPRAKEAIATDKPKEAYEAMHEVLKEVWAECYRVLKPGAFMCVNIGDATRTFGGHFKLYANHARIIEDCEELGFHVLPSIVWQKTVNAPNKFMGSGTLPAGAYVTLEHEFILIFRKPPARSFDDDQKQNRYESALFFEERNQWFLDRWQIAGVRQKLGNKDLRERSAAYHIDLPFRLIHMYSLLGDTVLDPFVGTGTTSLAAIATGRSSVGFELDRNLCNVGLLAGADLEKLSNLELGRLEAHRQFKTDYEQKKGVDFGYEHKALSTRIVSKQEASIAVYLPKQISLEGPHCVVTYKQFTGS